MRHATNRLFLLPLLFVLACAGLYAQANSELTGIVTDQTGAVVPGAKITLIDPATGAIKATESGATGLYDINGLNPATYNLKVAAKGFQAYAQNGVVVNVSATVRTDVKLTVGAESQTVTVQADSLQVQTDSNVVSTLISSEQISEIATQNRNFAALAALGLGVSSALPDSNTPTSVASNFTISVNGLRQSHNIWLIDGGEADDRGGAGGMDIMPSQDAIAEFNMLTSNYPPDYGISSGATMSLSLKSGTQKFHGTLWEFNRTPAYNAKEPISRTLTNAHYNIFGGNIGGPLFIPHVYNTNKNKTFFFVNEEWRKILSGAGTSNNPALLASNIPADMNTDLHYVKPAFSSNALTVPNVGATSAYQKNVLTPLGLVHGAASGTPGGFALDGSGNPIIPHQLFDSNAVTFLNTGVIPTSNQANGYNIFNAVNPIDVRDDIVRIDHKFTDKWALLGHYMHDSVSQGYAKPQLGWNGTSYNTITSTLSNPSNSAAIKLSGTLSPNLLVEASINYDGNVIDIVNSDNSKLPAGWVSNPVTPSFAVTRDALPGVSLGTPFGTTEDTASAPWHNAAQDYEPKVDISYTMGKHAMKYGFSYNRYTKNQQLFGNQQGTFSFGNLTNDSSMDLLLGLASSYGQFQAAPIRHYVNQTPSVYVMDNWHVTPRLSLQLGLRYDALPHAWERSNAVANFNPADYLQSQAPIWNADNTINSASPSLVALNGATYYLNGMGLAGQNGFPRGLVKNDFETLQPRVGFSEDLFGNGRTVLRGGFGTFFERMQGNDIYNAATNAPFAYNLSLSNTEFTTPGNNWLTGSTVSGVPVFSSGVTNLAHDYKAPAVAQFSLGVQHELSPAVIWVAQYVGNLAWHQNIQRHINTLPLSTGEGIRCIAGDGSGKYLSDPSNDISGPDSACTVGFTNNGGINAFRTYQGYNDINQQENTTNGNYNGFQSGLRLQNRWGLSGEVDYTFSHEIDITSYDLNGVSNPWNIKYDKGSGALDRRHILSINYVYKTPFFAHSTGFTKSLLGGWEVAGTALAQTGTIIANQGVGLSIPWDPVGLGGGYTNRPNQIAHTHYIKHKPSNADGGQWFDPSSFSAPVPSWLGGPNMGFGSARKDAVVGPGRLNFNTSLYKSFSITERAHVELRFESFNTFNHFEPNGVSSNLGTDNFGKVTNNFGQVTSAWDPRTLELGGKFVF
ncbi:MAG TPA: carboxypeptidase-like regulatory domain-containing protein [Terracidiphilus sp.]